MISAFDVKFTDNKNEIPPVGCRTPKNPNKKNNVKDMNSKKDKTNTMCRICPPKRSRTKALFSLWSQEIQMKTHLHKRRRTHRHAGVAVVMAVAVAALVVTVVAVVAMLSAVARGR